MAVLICMVLTTSVAAAPATDAPDKQAAPAIATKADASDDADIAARIRDIFGQIAALHDVRVRVSAGVVTLDGTVQAADDKGRAETIASRVSGVVTVQNDVTRDLAVGTKVAPAIGQFRDDLRAFARALPLVGVAIAVGLLIAALGYGLASVTRLWRWVAPNLFLAELLATSVRVVTVILGFVAAFEVLGATALLGGVLGGAGVVGIALGFAVRDTVTNYVASIMLSLRQPFRANDHVVIEGHEGRVMRLTSRATVMLTLDGNHVQIPNATVFNAVILNYIRNPQRRFEFDLGVDAADDPVDGMDVGLSAVNGLPFVLDTPKATAVIREVGDSNIVLRFYGWVDQTRTDFLKGRSLAIKAAKTALEGSGFALPEPIYRLRFDEGAALPVQRSAPVTERPPRRTATRSSPSLAGSDTAPDAHVERLVNAERAASGGKDDLLDPGRAVE
ncbi:mechanosensitive ion channel family protein [Lichenibacterium dinghuense]|uniref:mechanosensitive ion channel family protein n=1 Tax=Lichenibacterium dinghuense TaxID=2895977 RepID=UPI001F0152F1|nr:mechanosensitive ion channel domain-containing protein [Lichenibacterium sp. 6Y81]